MGLQCTVCDKYNGTCNCETSHLSHGCVDDALWQPDEFGTGMQRAEEPMDALAAFANVTFDGFSG